MPVKINQTAAVLTAIMWFAVTMNPNESRMWVMAPTIGLLVMSFVVLVVTTLIRIWR